MSRRAIAVLKKEVLEAVRDRRSAAAVVVNALVGPMVLFLILTLLGRQAADQGPWLVDLRHGDAAPGFEAALRHAGVVPDPDAGVRVEVPGDAVDLLRSGHTLRVVVTADLAAAEATVSRVREAVVAYGRTVASQRMLARGIPTALSNPITVDLNDTGALDLSSKVILSSILVILLAAPFFGGIALASDATAGERERHSLVPLLVQPVAPGEVAVGKWVAVSMASAVGALATVGGSASVLSQAPIADLGLRLAFGPGEATVLVLLLLPLCATAAAGQLLIALGSKTYKEGQTYLTLLTFLPLLVGFLWTSSLGARLSGRPFPLFWEMGAIAGLMSGQTPPVGTLLPALGTYAILVALLLVGVARQLRRAAVSSD